MKKIISCLAIAFVVASCTYKVDINPSDPEEEIRQAEADFNALVDREGIAKGFYTFAAENATIKRENDSLIKGKEGIRNYYSNPNFLKAKVTWSPDFVGVSKDGTLGYTYGKFKWTTLDSIGKPKEINGVFHTVWKKQADGSWKYVWD